MVVSDDFLGMRKEPSPSRNKKTDKKWYLYNRGMREKQVVASEGEMYY